MSVPYEDLLPVTVVLGASSGEIKYFSPAAEALWGLSHVPFNEGHNTFSEPWDVASTAAVLSERRDLLGSLLPRGLASTLLASLQEQLASGILNPNAWGLALLAPPDAAAHQAHLTVAEEGYVSNAATQSATRNQNQDRSPSQATRGAAQEQRSRQDEPPGVRSVSPMRRVLEDHYHDVDGPPPPGPLFSRMQSRTLDNLLYHTPRAPLELQQPPQRALRAPHEPPSAPMLDDDFDAPYAPYINAAATSSTQPYFMADMMQLRALTRPLPARPYNRSAGPFREGHDDRRVGGARVNLGNFQGGDGAAGGLRTLLDSATSLYNYGPAREQPVSGRGDGTRGSIGAGAVGVGGSGAAGWAAIGDAAEGQAAGGLRGEPHRDHPDYRSWVRAVHPPAPRVAPISEADEGTDGSERSISPQEEDRIRRPVEPEPQPQVQPQLQQSWQQGQERRLQPPVAAPLAPVASPDLSTAAAASDGEPLVDPEQSPFTLAQATGSPDGPSYQLAAQAPYQLLQPPLAGNQHNPESAAGIQPRAVPLQQQPQPQQQPARGALVADLAPGRPPRRVSTRSRLQALLQVYDPAAPTVQQPQQRSVAGAATGGSRSGSSSSSSVEGASPRTTSPQQGAAGSRAGSGRGDRGGSGGGGDGLPAQSPATGGASARERGGSGSGVGAGAEEDQAGAEGVEDAAEDQEAVEQGEEEEEEDGEEDVLKARWHKVRLHLIMPGVNTRGSHRGTSGPSSGGGTWTAAAGRPHAAAVGGPYAARGANPEPLLQLVAEDVDELVRAAEEVESEVVELRMKQQSLETLLAHELKLLEAVFPRQAIEHMTRVIAAQTAHQARPQAADAADYFNGPSARLFRLTQSVYLAAAAAAADAAAVEASATATADAVRPSHGSAPAAFAVAAAAGQATSPVTVAEAGAATAATAPGLATAVADATSVAAAAGAVPAVAATGAAATAAATARATAAATATPPAPMTNPAPQDVRAPSRSRQGRSEGDGGPGGSSNVPAARQRRSTEIGRPPLPRTSGPGWSGSGVSEPTRRLRKPGSFKFGVNAAAIVGVLPMLWSGGGSGAVAADAPASNADTLATASGVAVGGFNSALYGSASLSRGLGTGSGSIPPLPSALAAAMNPAATAPLASAHRHVTVMFADVVGFTSMCSCLQPLEVMTFLNSLFTRFDWLCDIYGVYKVETIGDCFMVVGGLITVDDQGFKAVRGDASEDALHALKVMSFAKSVIREVAHMSMPHNGQPLRLRVGLHSGPVVAGIVGSKMPRFCLFGDTVNTASRMESTCEPGCIHVSAATRDLLRDEPWVATGGVQVKGKGEMETYLWRPPLGFAATKGGFSASVAAVGYEHTTGGSGGGGGGGGSRAAISDGETVRQQIALMRQAAAAAGVETSAKAPGAAAGAGPCVRGIRGPGDVGGDRAVGGGGAGAAAPKRQQQQQQHV